MPQVCVSEMIYSVIIYVYAVECCYNAVQYNAILHRALRWLKQNINQGVNHKIHPISRGELCGVLCEDIIQNWPSYNELYYICVSLRRCQPFCSGFNVSSNVVIGLNSHCVVDPLTPPNLLSTGTFSCLMALFDFERQFGYYLTQIYVPSSLIIFMSWISFWLSPECSPARISLGITTLLTMASQMGSSAVSSLPKVRFDTAAAQIKVVRWPAGN